MGYIGQTPTAVALDGDDLANDIITLAKMASWNRWQHYFL